MAHDELYRFTLEVAWQFKGSRPTAEIAGRVDAKPLKRRNAPADIFPVDD
jgi:hypothetical protein